MKYDLGTTAATPEQDYRFCRIRRGWRSELEPELARELVILCHTPGIPIEWLFGVFKWSAVMRRKVMALINRADDANAEVQENQLSIMLEDGFAMLRVLDPPATYQGAIPLWSQLALQQERKPDVDRAAEFGVHPQKVHNWRTNQVFNPLNGQRIIPRRGNPNLILPFQNLLSPS